MFGKSSPQPAASPRPDRKTQSFLQTGVRFKGEMEVEGDLRIEGIIKGSLNVRGVLMVGSKAVLEGDIKGREVIIHGKAGGSIRADARIQLARGAKVKGDLYCQSLIIEEGVHFDGRSHMGEHAPSSPPIGGAGKDSRPMEPSDARVRQRSDYPPKTAQTVGVGVASASGTASPDSSSPRISGRQ